MVGSVSTIVDNHLRASQAAQRRGDFDAMLREARHANRADAADSRARFRLLECQLYCGQIDRVIVRLGEFERDADSDHESLCRIAEYYTHCADHESALRCYRRAVGLQPNNPEYLFAMAAAEIASGDLQAAERHLTEVISLDPHDYDAYRNRSTLKKQSRENNHIAEIEALLAQGTKVPAGEAQLCFALAKEYEDLGEDEVAFAYLKRGADKRRSIMNYRVEGDVDVMQRLRAVFDADLMRQEPAACQEPGPIFILGLPRSGTTLVDRILSSHSRVDSLGEINNFAYSLMHTIGQAADKLRLIDLSASIDFAALGQRYCDSLQGFGRAGPLLIDKTPLNYLYIGLIRLALPAARIVHVHRNPMDSCYGMYRTLFRAGYPFSYDLDDLAQYYLAYTRLMEHWRTVTNSGFFEISYEALIEDQETVSRELVAYCGLDWEPACLAFHENPAAVSTASSAQVRQPVYRDALQRWRRYEAHLRPLRDTLRSGGVDVDAQ